MAKTFTFDNQGGMYVNIGSTSNACEASLRMPHTAGDDPCKELETRAGIWKFEDNKLGQVQDLKNRYATGIRNAVALDWNFSSGKHSLLLGTISAFSQAELLSPLSIPKVQQKSNIPLMSSAKEFSTSYSPTQVINQGDCL